MGCVPIKKPPHKQRNKPNPKKKSILDNEVIANDLESFLGQCTLKGLLGYGKDGHVLLVESIEISQQVAVKVISSKNLSVDQLTKEVENLSEVDHPNIVKYFKHQLSEEYFYVAMEYCAGGDLFQRITDKDNFTEEEAADIMECLLRAINHCHYLGIIHRDLKPENIMYSSDNTLKIIDFGLSMKAGTESKEEIAGTPLYIAPEVLLSQNFTKACDIWSLGIIMHVLITGCTPISGNTVEEVYRKIETYKGPGFYSSLWKSVSEEAKDLLRKMLDLDPETRITAAEALKHPWFTLRKRRLEVSTRSVIRAFKNYSELSDLKKNLLSFLVKNISDKEVKEFQEIFLELDKEKTGQIKSSNLEKILTTDDEITTEELKVLIRKINNELYINYSTFIAALISTSEFLTEAKLKLGYKSFEFEQQENPINESFNSSLQVKREVLITDSSEPMQQDIVNSRTVLSLTNKKVREKGIRNSYGQI